MKIVPQSVTLLDYQGSDLSTVNAARVSFNKESTWEFINPPAIDPFGNHISKYSDRVLSGKDIKLINYLAKHNHWSPFAHNSLTFRIKAPIFVARQLVKHQVGGVWNEVSRRYVDEEPEFYLPTLWHKKPENAKQGASEEVVDFGEDKDMPWLFTNTCLAAYLDLLDMQVAPEEARMFLPLNTMTEWWWTGSLMFFARVCKQRLDSHAQNATREVAQLIADAIPNEFTHSWKALMGQGS